MLSFVSWPESGARGVFVFFCVSVCASPVFVSGWNGSGGGEWRVAIVVVMLAGGTCDSPTSFNATPELLELPAP